MYSVTLGSDGPHVTGLGLGCMGMSDFYGAAEHDESIATLRAARDRGLDFFDTGDFYGAGHNELLLREAFDTAARQKLIYSVKFGAMRDPAGGFVGFDCRPAAVKSALAYSLQRLRHGLYRYLPPRPPGP